MNSLHDQGHKRTSINELLNPVASAPPGHLDQHPSYAPNQLQALSPQGYIPAAHHQHVSAPPSYPPQIHTPGSSFSLRAASWDHRAQEGINSRRQEADPAASCRYTPQPVNSHPGYQEQYSRPVRPADEPSNYSIDVPPWPNSHEHHNIPYPHPVVAPMYTDERGGESLTSSSPPQLKDSINQPSLPILPQFPSPCRNLPHIRINTQAIW